MLCKILVAEDEPGIRAIVAQHLKREGFSVRTAADGAEALELFYKDNYSMIILDIMMEGLNGFDTCRLIRQSSYAPILFLSAMSGETEKVAALIAGGDDYLCKPFSAAELIARVRSLLRRYTVYQGPGHTEPEKEQLVLGMDNEVIVNGQTVKLSYTEYEILHLFLKRRGQVLSISEIYEAIWTEPYSYSANNIVMVHIYKLRRKLEQDCKHPTILKTAWGKGYYIE